MYKNDENNDEINNRRDFKASKVNNNTNAQEPEQPRSFLADLFKEPSDSDPIEAAAAAAARAKRFGRTPDINPNQSGSFTK